MVVGRHGDGERPAACHLDSRASALYLCEFPWFRVSVERFLSAEVVRIKTEAPVSSRRLRRSCISPLSISPERPPQTLGQYNSLVWKTLLWKSTSPCLFRPGWLHSRPLSSMAWGRRQSCPLASAFFKLDIVYCCTYTLPWNARSFPNPWRTALLVIRLTRFGGAEKRHRRDDSRRGPWT